MTYPPSDCIQRLLIPWLAILLFLCSDRGSFASPPIRSQTPKKPNVVILLADDLGFRDIGCYGGPVRTPALDGLAKQGTRFSQFYSGCAVCSPSRATLLTGRHHIRTGVYSWIHDPSQKSHLLLREITLAEVLKDAGYSTAHVGKWHLGLPTANHAKPTPDRHGFDHWFATWNNAEPSHKNPRNFIRNGKPVGKIEGYSCQIVADEAIKWLEQRKDNPNPFFLNVWFHEPHAPIAAPESIVRKYGPSKDQAAVYSGTIANTDQAVQRLLAKFKELGVTDNTLIVYASDNGSYREDRTGGLRGRKGMNWEGGIRVPGIFVWPGVIQSDSVSAIPAGLVDVLPTVCGLLGLQNPENHLDGADLTPILKGKTPDWQRQQPLFWHLQKSRPIVAMRDGDYSLVADPDYEISRSNMFQEEWIPRIRSGGYQNFQLFNLSDDPQQIHNIAADHPELLEQLKSKLLRINRSIMDEAYDWTSE